MFALNLSPEDLKLIAEIAREEWVPQNTVIFQQGDEGNMMFVIVEGHLHVLRCNIPNNDNHKQPS